MTNQTLGGGESREKFWTELTETQKLDRARGIIKSLARQVSELQADMHHLKEGLCNHSHGEKGILVPWNGYRTRSEGIALNTVRGEEYF